MPFVCFLLDLEPVRPEGVFCDTHDGTRLVVGLQHFSQSVVYVTGDSVSLYRKKHQNRLAWGWDEEKNTTFAKKIVQNDTTFRNNSYICTDSNSPKGWAGHILLVKRTFTNVIFSIWISQIQALEDTQLKRPLWVYCTLSILLRQSQYISAWAIELLILVRGNARAQMRDRRSRAPTSFAYIIANIINRWIWVAIGRENINMSVALQNFKKTLIQRSHFLIFLSI